jgi:hypothetical protein
VLGVAVGLESGGRLGDEDCIALGVEVGTGVGDGAGRTLGSGVVGSGSVGSGSVGSGSGSDGVATGSEGVGSVGMGVALGAGVVPVTARETAAAVDQAAPSQARYVKPSAPEYPAAAMYVKPPLASRLSEPWPTPVTRLAES